MEPYKYVVQNGVSLQPYTGDAIQYSNYIYCSRGYNADYKGYNSSFDVTKYKTASFRYTNASDGYAPSFYVGTSGWQYNASTATSGNVTIDISAQTGVVNFGAACRLNNTNFRLTEIVFFK